MLLFPARRLRRGAHAPHYRLLFRRSPAATRTSSGTSRHCDYFDAGFREAVQFVSRHAEPARKLSTEIDWPARLYAHAAGRPDLRQTLVRRGRACRSGRVCYVWTQAGRWYFLNQDAVAICRSALPGTWNGCGRRWCGVSVDGPRDSFSREEAEGMGIWCSSAEGGSGR